jgi:hypothetical protein
MVRIVALKQYLRGELPGWEDNLRVAELANDELGLPPFTQVQPSGPDWKPSPASLLGIAPYVHEQADKLARSGKLDALRFLVEDERRRYSEGIARVDDRLGQVETWLGQQRK